MSDDRSKGLLNNKSFWVRTASGIVLAGVLLLVFVIGYELMFWFLLALSLAGLFELYRAIGLKLGLLSVTGFLTCAAHFIFARFLGFSSLIFVCTISLTVMLAAFVFTFPGYSLTQLFGAYFGVFYVGASLSLMYFLRIHPPAGAYLVWLVVISSWGCDIFAYLIGMLFGKRKLVPRLSPNKSVEGAIGGICGSVAIALVYGLCVMNIVPGVKLAPLSFALICFMGAIAGQIGDLAASAIKRKVNIKDYGRLIPGHGGILDRFDSMIIVSPIIYVVAVYVVMIG